MAAKIRRGLIEYELKYSREKDQQILSKGNDVSFLTEPKSVSRKSPTGKFIPLPSAMIKDFPIQIASRLNRPSSSHRRTPISEPRCSSPSRILLSDYLVERRRKPRKTKKKRRNHSIDTYSNGNSMYGSDRLVRNSYPSNPSESPSLRKINEDYISGSEEEEDIESLNSVEEDAFQKYLQLRYLVTQNSSHIRSLVDRLRQQTALQTNLKPVNYPPKKTPRPRSARSFASALGGMKKDIERKKDQYLELLEKLKNNEYDEYYQASLSSSSVAQQEQIQQLEGRVWDHRFIAGQSLSPPKVSPSRQRPQSAQARYRYYKEAQV